MQSPLDDDITWMMTMEYSVKNYTAYSINYYAYRNRH